MKYEGVTKKTSGGDREFVLKNDYYGDGGGTQTAHELFTERDVTLFKDKIAEEK